MVNAPRGAAFPLLARLPGVAAASRLPVVIDRVDAVPWRAIVVLLTAGLSAAVLTAGVRVSPGIPGHHILFATFPIALGLALVPRRGAGTAMGLTAGVAAIVMQLAGVRMGGVGAITSLLLTGPFLDLALGRDRSGWRLYAAFVLAGAASNAAAFLVRGSAKLAGLGVGPGSGMGGGLGRGGGRALHLWLPQAVWTHALAGVLAGLLSAVAWFHLRPASPPGADPPNGG